MHERARQLLELLVESPDAMSRNRHFGLFEDARAADIRRRAAHLRRLRDNLLSQEAILVDTSWEGSSLTLSLRYDSGIEQKTWLNGDEAQILKKSLISKAPAQIRAQLESW